MSDSRSFVFRPFQMQEKRPSSHAICSLQQRPWLLFCSDCCFSACSTAILPARGLVVSQLKAGAQHLDIAPHGRPLLVYSTVSFRRPSQSAESGQPSVQDFGILLDKAIDPIHPAGRGYIFLAGRADCQPLSFVALPLSRIPQQSWRQNTSKSHKETTVATAPRSSLPLVRPQRMPSVPRHPLHPTVHPQEPLHRHSSQTGTTTWA